MVCTLVAPCTEPALERIWKTSEALVEPFDAHHARVSRSAGNRTGPLRRVVLWRELARIVARISTRRACTSDTLRIVRRVELRSWESSGQLRKDRVTRTEDQPLTNRPVLTMPGTSLPTTLIFAPRLNSYARPLTAPRTRTRLLPR